MLLLVLFACTPTTSVYENYTDDGLLGRTWELKHIAFKSSDTITLPPIESLKNIISFSIREGSKTDSTYESVSRGLNYKFQGQGPLNQFGGNYGYQNLNNNSATVVVENFWSSNTLSADIEVREFENAIFKVLSDITKYDLSLENNLLVISSDNSNSLLVFNQILK